MCTVNQWSISSHWLKIVDEDGGLSALSHADKETFSLAIGVSHPDKELPYLRRYLKT
jgi:hypothetical protein